MDNEELKEKMKNDIEENLMVGILDLIVLKLIAETDMYGYQIKHEIMSRSKNTIRIKEGTLYGPLYRMEKKGMISVRRELVGARRFRMYYHLEDLGKQYLEIALKSYETILEGAGAIIGK